MDVDLETKLKIVKLVSYHRTSHHWEWLQQPWTRVHADYAGLFLGRCYLINAHSKWMEAHITSSAISSVTIDKMRATFTTI